MQLTLGARKIDGVTVIDCQGRIIFGDESIALREFVKQQLRESNNLVINLAGVNYIDSGGLGTLVGLYTSARSHGGHIKLANLTHRVGELLQLTKLLTVFDVHDNEVVAAQSFTERRATA